MGSLQLGRGGGNTFLMGQTMATTNQKNMVITDQFSEQGLQEDTSTDEKTKLEEEKSKVTVADSTQGVSELVADLSIVDQTPIAYIQYSDETQMPLIMRLIQKDLSELIPFTLIDTSYT